MDLSSLETVIETIKIGGLVAGSAAVGTVGLLGFFGLMVDYSERKIEVKEMTPAYEHGFLRKKPNVRNIRKMTNPESAHLYYTTLVRYK